MARFFMKEAQLKESVVKRMEFKKNSKIWYELVVAKGKARVDIAKCNTEELVGWELKTEFDNLKRLDRQVVWFSKVFDQMTLVVHEKHLKKSIEKVPDWWRVESYSGNEFKIIQEGKNNPKVSVATLCKLLWRDELVIELRKLGETCLSKLNKSQLRMLLWRKREPEIVKKIVRNVLLKREEWLTDISKISVDRDKK